MAALPHLMWCEPCHQDLSADHGAYTTSKASNINSDWIKKKDFFLSLYVFGLNFNKNTRDEGRCLNKKCGIYLNLSQYQRWNCNYYLNII